MRALLVINLQRMFTRSVTLPFFISCLRCSGAHLQTQGDPLVSPRSKTYITKTSKNVAQTAARPAFRLLHISQNTLTHTLCCVIKITLHVRVPIGALFSIQNTTFIHSFSHMGNTF